MPILSVRCAQLRRDYVQMGASVWPPPLWLRPLRQDDEGAVRTAEASMHDEAFEFAFNFTRETDWAEYLSDLDRQRAGLNLAEGRVPATFLVAEADGEIVGRSSIRHRLNPFLEHEGGHIGYCVLRQFRRRGFATQILRQSLVIARSVGVERALVTCDDDNLGSITIIERCGGNLEDVVMSSINRVRIRRYWFGY